MKNKKTTAKQVKTVLTITVGFILVYFITKRKWALNASFIIGLLGMLSDYLAKQIDYLWMKLTWLLSLVIPNILLTVIFYVFLTPIALFSRIFGKSNPLSLKNPGSTLFRETNKSFPKEAFEHPW